MTGDLNSALATSPGSLCSSWEALRDVLGSVVWFGAGLGGGVLCPRRGAVSKPRDGVLCLSWAPVSKPGSGVPRRGWGPVSETWSHIGLWRWGPVSEPWSCTQIWSRVPYESRSAVSDCGAVVPCWSRGPCLTHGPVSKPGFGVPVSKLWSCIRMGSCVGAVILHLPDPQPRLCHGPHPNPEPCSRVCARRGRERLWELTPPGPRSPTLGDPGPPRPARTGGCDVCEAGAGVSRGIRGQRRALSRSRGVPWAGPGQRHRAGRRPELRLRQQQRGAAPGLRRRGVRQAGWRQSTRRQQQ